MTTAMPARLLMAHPSLNGCRPVSGLWLPADWFDEARRRRLLLQYWRPGALAHRFEAGDLLRFPQAVMLDCEGLPAWPLVADGTALSSAEMTRPASGVFRGDVWLVSGGLPVSLDWRDGEALDPSAWLDLRQFTVVDMVDWSVTVAQPAAEPVVRRPILEVLNGKVAAPSSGQLQFMRELQSRRTRMGASGAGLSARRAGYRPPVVLPPWLGQGLGRAWKILCIVGGGFFLLGIVSALVDAMNSDNPVSWLWLLVMVAMAVWALWGGGAGQRRVFASGGRGQARRTAAGAAADSARKGGSGAASAGAGHALPARRLAWVPPRWRALAERAAILSRFSKVIGMKQARYVQRMLGMFESGDLDQALKHAIPLGGMNDNRQPTALGAPTPSQRLDLNRGMDGTTGIAMGDDLEAHLRQIYRKTFEHLKRQKKVDEAVYVLAVLLNARREALDYLEAEGRFAQAAELALSWDQAPDVIVRLHCLAGDWRKALAIARRDKSFASAVRQLEGKWPQAAARLRGEWGAALVEQGEWTAAIDTVWSLPEMREQAVRWLEQAEQAGGHVGARALVQRAVLLPDTLARHHAKIAALGREPVHRGERAVMARALLAVRQPGKGCKSLAAAIAPMLLHDVASGWAHVDTKLLQALVNLSDDRYLQADLPAGWPKAAQPDWRARPFDEQAPDPGACAVFDAVALEGGCWLLALGEAGVTMTDGSGRCLHRFNVPADLLVAGASAQNALALRRRESLWRVGRLDLVRRASKDLGMLRADCVAESFDGIAWTVGRERELLVLDAGQDLADVLWHVADLPGRVIGLVSGCGMEHLLLAPGEEGESPQLWRYELPSRRLLQRDAAEMSQSSSMPLLHSRHGLINLRIVREAEGGLCCSWNPPGQRAVSYRFEADADHIVRAWAGGEWLLLAAALDGELSIRLVRFADAGHLGTVHWPPGVRLGGRWSDEGGFTLFDNQGRLVSLNPSLGQMSALALR